MSRTAGESRSITHDVHGGGHPFFTQQAADVRLPLVGGATERDSGGSERALRPLGGGVSTDGPQHGALGAR